MNDPVQMLIDAGAIPASPFGPSSRYANVAIGRYSVATDDARGLRAAPIRAASARHSDCRAPHGARG